MAMSELFVVTEEQIIRYLNYCGAVVIAPLVLQKVLTWEAHDKSSEETYLDYLQRKLNVGEEDFKTTFKAFQSEINLIKQDNDGRQFDVTLLTRLIKILYKSENRTSLSEELNRLCSDKPAQQSYLEYFRDTVKVSYITNVIVGDDLKTITEACDSSELEEKLMKILIYEYCKRKKITHSSNVLNWVLKLTDLRNEVCHTNGKNPKLHTDIKQTAESLLKVSSVYHNERHCSSQVDAKQEYTHLQEVYKKLEMRRPDDVLNLSIQIFKEFGRYDIRNFWAKNSSTIMIPFTGNLISENVYHPLDFAFETQLKNDVDKESEDKNNHGLVSGNSKQVVSYSNLLSPWHKNQDTSVTIIVGEAGAGKSTLVRQIARQFLNQSTHCLMKISEFEILYYYECRNEFVSSFENLVIETFPTTLEKLGERQLLACFPHMKNLVIIDGFDERHDVSTKVFISFLDKVNKSKLSNFIITTRPYAVCDLQMFLNDKRICHRVCNLVDIGNMSDQIRFLKRYEDFADDDVKGLVTTFKDLPSELREYFKLPIQLVWVFFLYLEDSDSVKSWLVVSDALKHTWRYYERVLTHKLRQKVAINLESFIRKIMQEISRFCFYNLAAQSVIFRKKDMDKMIDKCMEIIEQRRLDNMVDAQHLFSSLESIFLSKNYQDNSKGYQLYHKTHQELFASKFLIEKLRNNENQSVCDVISSILGSNALSHDGFIQRYCSIFFFIVN